MCGSSNGKRIVGNRDVHWTRRRYRGRKRKGELLNIKCEYKITKERCCWKPLVKGRGNDKIRGISGYRRKHSVKIGTYTARVSRTDYLAPQVADREAQRSPLRVRFVLLCAFVRSHVSPVRLRDDVVRRKLSLSRCRRSRDTCACLRSFFRLFPTIISIRTWPSETRW